ncbi:MAG: transporter substrate-binding domain-containing protein [Rhodospirillaceae bacterium]|nr:transporter substrate-binding domain-containing protein [Rhodospirillaceae bacterium]
MTVPPRPSGRCAAFLLAILITLSAAWPAAADRLAEIRERGTLVVGVKADYAPFGSRNSDGEIVGYDVDIARGFAERLGVDLLLVPVTSADRLQKLERGDIDVVVATLGDTRERRQLVTMIEPHYYGDGANLLLRPDSGVERWSDLHGMTVCGVQGSLWNRPAAERLLVDVVSFNTTRETRLALRDGQCVGWLFDEVALLHELETGDWPGYSVPLPTIMVLPWAVAIARSEAGGPLDRLLGDTLAEWHRSGWLRQLEQRWDLPPSSFLRDANQLWQRTDEAGAPVCRRGEDGLWPLDCRELALATADEVGGVTGLSLWILEATGLNISILHDPFDRHLFLVGLGWTALLAVSCLAGSVGLGIVLGWLIHRRLPIVRPLLLAAASLFRMTPPLLQLYVVFFGLGAVVAATGFTVNGFAVAVAILSLYAGSANAVAFAEAADVAALHGGHRLGFTGHDIRRAFALGYATIMGNSVNVVKATGLASTIAVPELIHASASIVADKGNAVAMMNILLICYFALILLTVKAFQFLERRAVRP